MPDARTKRVDIIIGRGLLTAEAVASELRTRLADQLGELYRFLPEITLLAEARRILSQFEPILAENIARTDLAAWVSGFDEVSKDLPPAIQAHFLRMFGGGPPRPPRGLILPWGSDDDEPIVRFPMIERAADILLDKNILTREQFDAADAAAQARAFTVAGDLSRDTIETIRDVLAETIDEGASLEAFKDNLGGRLQKSFAGPGHLETVFRTNTQAAFHDGHDALADNPIVAEVFPYQEYLAVHDRRARKEHQRLEELGIDGTGVYRRSDPFWNVFTPPWDFNCRCGINLLTIEAAARRGVREAATWLRTGVKPPMVSMLPKIPFRPPAGFGNRRAVAA